MHEPPTLTSPWILTEAGVCTATVPLAAFDVAYSMTRFEPRNLEGLGYLTPRSFTDDLTILVHVRLLTKDNGRIVLPRSWASQGILKPHNTIF